MSPDQREILERVARGELTPEEADRLLSSDEPQGPPEARREPTNIRRVRIEAGFGAISVIGDPDVAEAEVDGPHTASIDGDTLVVSADFDGAQPVGVFAINLRQARRAIRVQRHGSHGRRGSMALRVRMNPALELDARLDAGPLAIGGIAAPIRARSSAGPITIDDASAPLDVAVNAGAIRINGILQGGDSRLRSDAGAIRVELGRGSSVEILATAALGKVVLPDGDGGGKGFGSTRRSIVGEGAGTLRVETAMGSIHVSADD
jgi:hypothetical protein